MLAAAPFSLAVFTLTLPFPLITSTLYGPRDWVMFALALVNLIAFARVTYAWHRAAVPGDGSNVETARGGTGEARHLALLGIVSIALMVLARTSGDLPYVIYMLMGGSDASWFYGVLLASVLVVWLPVLYAAAAYALSLPSAAVKGEYRFREMRVAMRYPRWPLMLGLFALLVLAGFAAGSLRPLTYGFTDGIVPGAVGAVLCVAMTFVLTAMFAAAYRDSAP